MTLVPDFGIGIAVFTNRSPSEVPSTLTWYLIDRLRGREPIDWRQRFGKRREEFIAQMRADKDAWAKARHPNTRPGHELAAYAGRYEHPAYGVMAIEDRGGALHWSWRGMFAPMAHRHYETFELPEVPDRLLPDRLPITFLTDREGNIVSLSTPLEPMVKDIVFARLATGECTEPAFRARCVGTFKSGPTVHRVTLRDGQLVLELRLPADLPPGAPAGPQVPHCRAGGVRRRVPRRGRGRRRGDLPSAERDVRGEARGGIALGGHRVGCTPRLKAPRDEQQERAEQAEHQGDAEEVGDAEDAHLGDRRSRTGRAGSRRRRAWRR